MKSSSTTYLDRPVDLQPGHAEVLELHQRHRRGGVLERRLIDPRRDRQARARAHRRRGASIARRLSTLEVVVRRRFSGPRDPATAITHPPSLPPLSSRPPTKAARAESARGRTRSTARGGRAASDGALLQAERLDPDVVLLRVARVDAVGERLDERQQGGVGADERGRVRRVIEPDTSQPCNL